MYPCLGCVTKPFGAPASLEMVLPRSQFQVSVNWAGRSTTHPYWILPWSASANSYPDFLVWLLPGQILGSDRTLFWSTSAGSCLNLLVWLLIVFHLGSSTDTLLTGHCATLGSRPGSTRWKVSANNPLDCSFIDTNPTEYFKEIFIREIHVRY